MCGVINQMSELDSVSEVVLRGGGGGGQGGLVGRMKGVGTE